MNSGCDMAFAGSCRQRDPARPWKRSALWLSFLAPFFFLSYGLSNMWAAQLPEVSSVFYSWEHRIPFLPWTIIPYWSIDVLYGLSFFLCVSRAEVDVLGKRLLSAQVIAVSCFIAFPLSFAFARPETESLPGVLFTLLESFDRPFNQAPSLHIALLVILWGVFTRYVTLGWSWLFHAWFALIGLSVLTTYQHHFIDVPTGVLLGVFCNWLWPDEGDSPLADCRLSRDRRRLFLALAYAAGSALLGMVAVMAGGMALWLAWPAVSLFLVALAYAVLGEVAFQKQRDGQMSLAAKCLLAPYLAGAWVNSRLWTRMRPDPIHVRDDIWIGRFPSARDVREEGFASVIDLTAEMFAPGVAANWQSTPCLDLATPRARVLSDAAIAIERLRKPGKVLVCCALGYSRSAAAIATWLLLTKRSASVEEAVAKITECQPHIVLKPDQFATIALAARIAGE